MGTSNLNKYTSRTVWVKIAKKRVLKKSVFVTLASDGATDPPIARYTKEKRKHLILRLLKVGYQNCSFAQKNR